MASGLLIELFCTSDYFLVDFTVFSRATLISLVTNPKSSGDFSFCRVSGSMPRALPVSACVILTVLYGEGSLFLGHRKPTLAPAK